jgi:hypothetical protein
MNPSFTVVAISPPGLRIERFQDEAKGSPQAATPRGAQASEEINKQ